MKFNENGTISFGAAMTKKRLEMGLTVSALSKLTNLGAGLLGTYEREESEPGNEDFKTLCDTLGLNARDYVDDLMRMRVDRYNYLQTRKHERMQQRLASKRQNSTISDSTVSFKPNHSVCQFCKVQFPFNTGYELAIFEGKIKVFKEHACKDCYRKNVLEQVKAGLVVKTQALK